MPDFQRVIRSITFQPDGSIAVEYVEPAIDIKSNGVQLQHVLFVPVGSDYDDEIEAVQDAAAELLADALEDVGKLGPPSPFGSQPEEDDDDEEPDDDRCSPCRHNNHGECVGCSCECPGFAR